jgi:type IV pilus assembly protein PilC
MPKYSYVVKDKEGKSYKNVIEADSQQGAIDRLQKLDYFIISIQELSSSPQRRQSTATSIKKPKKFGHKKVKLDDLLVFSRQLATMMESGVTLIRSVDVILSQVESQELHQVLSKVKSNVEQGGTLSSSLAQHPKVFNQFWVSLIEVGEASGTIPTVLNKLAFYMEQQAAFRSTITSAIIYPAILFCVAMGAVGFFAFFVGPKFESVFKQMNAQLPLITVVLLSTFKFIKTNFFWLFSGIIAVVFLLRKYFSTYTGRLVKERFIYGIPTIGNIYKLIIVERFASQMSILIDAGVPILYALDITERLVDNNTCALIVNNIKEGVRKGELLVDPMERSGFFPPMCVQMIMVGEETGEVSKMLKHVSNFYQSTVETYMKRFGTIIEPFMLVFMGAIIGTIVIAMFLPMFNLSQLGGGGG